MSIKRGDRVFDLLGELGAGTVVDIYTNYKDDPQGKELAVCRFGIEGAKNDEEDETIVCDRSFDQISTDPSLTGAPSAPRM